MTRIDRFESEHDEEQVSGELYDPAREIAPRAKDQSKAEKNETRERQRGEAGGSHRSSDLHGEIVARGAERNSKDGGKNRGRKLDETVAPFRASHGTPLGPKPIRPRVGRARTE